MSAELPLHRHRVKRGLLRMDMHMRLCIIGILPLNTVCGSALAQSYSRSHEEEGVQHLLKKKMKQ
eukprot:1150810-Pelagomonas_calceolata.AAC.4